jgi:hypothetical protein
MELAGAIYGGCIVSASLNIYVQKDKQGIRACLNAIQFRKAGEPFGTVVGDQRSKLLLLLVENLCSAVLVVLLLGQKHLRVVLVVLFEQVVLHIVLLLGRKHRKVALSLGQYCGCTDNTTLRCSSTTSNSACSATGV